MSKSNMVYSYTYGKIKKLESISDTGAGKAALANLRRGIGKKPGELPQLWGIFLERIPTELSVSRGVSNAELAIYTALTLYALHRQGSDYVVNVSGISVGTAAAKLIKTEDDLERILKRLNVIVTAVSVQDMAYHLKGLITLLKNEGIALDYAALARDLYIFSDYEQADNITLKWGKDFYSEYSKTKNKSEGEDNNG